MSEKQNAKDRYFKKKLSQAPIVLCACGCGTEMKSADAYGRKKKFINGHNGRKHDVADKWAIQKAWVRRNRDWVNARRQRISRQRKVLLILKLGGTCEVCGEGYNGRNGAAFEFHHREPKEKLLQIGSALCTVSLEKLLAEIRKCALLCANCHQILHGGEF